ncbi:hypothetical protein [uncultured Sphingomonas sp.]|uniref:hypothetical protein n=1 Tax=uncultured Sphingomonas sp. TaxID=158754 RepID=UPI0025EA5AFA|nr:hypothetical protein [uncultured Sphingomonas sp.]
MSTYRILDCTLRDGGYYTDWDFEEPVVRAYFDGVSKLPIAAFEVGYCNDPQPGYRGEWCYLGADRLRWVRSKLRDDQVLAVMLDVKDVSVDRVRPLLGDLVGVVDMVRMAVAPKDFPKGLALAAELKAMGFAVGFNTMYLSKYGEDLAELEPLLAGPEHIDVLALVDSYGGCSPAEVAAKVTKARAMFPGIEIGYHGHDNTCLAYANALAAIEAGAAVIDSTFVGMGRGAGNTRTEMMIVHKLMDGEADGRALDAAAPIVAEFERLRDQYGWGTNFPYMLSGATSLPQKDVMDWLGKRRYSPVAVIRALQAQGGGAIDAAVYPDLRPNNLPENAADRVVVIGGGPSVRRHLDAIRRFVDRTGAVVVHANTVYQSLVGKVGGAELLCLPGHAVEHLPEDFDASGLVGMVVPEAPRFEGTVPDQAPCPIYQAAPFGPIEGERIGPVSDIGPLALAAGAARALSARTFYLVGFDGYDNATVAEQELASEIQATINRLRDETTLDVVSITPTRYRLPVRSVYVEAEMAGA